MTVGKVQATLDGQRLESTADTTQLDLFGQKKRSDDGFEVVEVKQEGPWKVEVSKKR